MGRVTIREWQGMFVGGMFNSCDRTTQVKAGWYDWFCDHSQLGAKTQKMGRIIAKIGNDGKVNLDKQYVFFKNSCPMVGPLYDSFKICDGESANVVYCIDNRNRRWQVYSAKNDWNEPIFEGSASALVKYLNTKEIA